MSTEIYFSNNYRDLCQQHGTGAGFQFEFSCARCYDTWRSPFEPYTGGRAADWVGKAVNAAWGLLGRTGSTIGAAADGLAGAGWGSARDSAFQRAIGNAEGHFNRCARCTHYVCGRCWNGAQGLCLNCAPDTAAEATAAQQRGLNDMAAERAYAAGQRDGQSYDVDRARQLVCPQCRTETHGTPFCPGCGHHLAQQPQCPSCSAALPDGAAFCPGCGTRR
ncbi:double zinc ribbon domain-containing protein [Peterkaempfera bronchialis]|uniref:Zinc-ribbon domain-containing protein n=1 Tax=Peterkaempfera bronchialis TaxID=2126346 RepID=A0A345SXD6_9ACTN|nr:zinc ribbon domain-containing protein [Peterkaempfera bronchialis]AXI78391.1 zinc-ribbon domain-containing protein [Peterkaempfera bronchialis]